MVRLEVMDAFDYDYQKYRPESAFPLPRTQYQKLYLNATDSHLHKVPVSAESQAVYDSETGEVHFDYTFTDDTELTGHSKLKLWVEADAYNNMDLFVVMSKLSADGEPLPLYYVDRDRYSNTPLPKLKAWSPANGLDAEYAGPMGRMRVSRRKLDETLSTDYLPVQSHTCDEYLAPGQIVPVEIEILPTSWIWHKGQTLRITICGKYVRHEKWLFAEMPEYDNKGNHIIHTGGQYDSYLQIPVIPPKYQDRYYTYR